MATLLTVFYKTSKRIEHTYDLPKCASFPLRLRIAKTLETSSIFEDNDYIISHATQDIAEAMKTSRVSVPVEECPYCGNTGSIIKYVAIDPAIGSPLQQMTNALQYIATNPCRFCHEVPNSRYNVEKLAKTTETGEIK